MKKNLFIYNTSSALYGYGEFLNKNNGILFPILQYKRDKSPVKNFDLVDIPIMNILTPIYKWSVTDMGALCFKELCFTHCHDSNQEWRLYITPLIWHDDFISLWRVSIPRYDNFPLIPGDLNPSFRDTFSNIDNFIIFGRKCAFF